MSTGHKADRGQPGGRDAQNRKIWRKVHDVSIGLDSRKYSAGSVRLHEKVAQQLRRRRKRAG